MKPRLHEQTSNTGYVEEIISCISNFDCSSFFGSHLGKSQPQQKQKVNEFQRAICNQLASDVANFSWQLEYSPSTAKRDSVDIFGSNSDASVVIELDKHRADQVAKKFVSRNALFIGNPVFYISLCYPGTIYMNSSECIKYFGYCKKLSKYRGNEYAGFIIE